MRGWRTIWCLFGRWVRVFVLTGWQNVRWPFRCEHNKGYMRHRGRVHKGALYRQCWGLLQIWPRIRTPRKRTTGKPCAATLADCWCSPCCNDAVAGMDCSPDNHPDTGWMNFASRTRSATSVSESESRYVKHVISGNTASVKLNKCITNFSTSRIFKI